MPLPSSGSPGSPFDPSPVDPSPADPSKGTSQHETRSGPRPIESEDGLRRQVEDRIESAGGAARADFSGLHLVGADLRGLDLTRANLAGLDLSRARLKDSVLFGATLRDAVLFEADLEGCELAGADLSGANLVSANLSRAGLGLAKLVGANLVQANLSGATLTEATLQGSNLQLACLTRVRAPECDLRSADLARADLRHAELDRSRVDHASFEEVDLREASFKNLRGFQKANWIGVDLRDIDFTGAYLCRNFIMDQNFLEEFKNQSRTTRVAYEVWRLTSNCGRSVSRWAFCTAVFVCFFAWIYTLVGIDYGDYETPLSPLYFSVVILSTLGFGDVLPASMAGQIVAMLEVLTGYVMLGGLLSIFSNRMASRAHGS